MMGLTKAERAVASDLFAKAADMFSARSCNDYPLPDTPENRQLLADVWRWAGDANSASRVASSPPGDTLYGYDWLIMRFLSAKFLGEQ